jgi:ABC-2 type transport system permease protein
MMINRILLIAKREFLSNVKRRSYLFTAFGLPLIIAVAQFAMGAFIQSQSQTTGTLGEIGYVDLTGNQILSQAIDKPEEFTAYPTEEAARTALISGEIGAFFVIPADYVRQGIVHAFSIQDIPRGIEEQMNAFLTDNLLADWPPERAARLKNPSRLTFSTLDGEKTIVGDESAVAVILLPIVLALLFMMSIFTTSGFLLQGVVEEKESRLIEILVTAVNPNQLLWGKILGLGALGLLQILVWSTAGALLLSQGSSIWSSLENVTIPAPLLIWGPPYLLLGYILYGSLLASIGAAVTSMQEAQQISSIVSLIAAAPMLLSMTFFNNANGPVPTTLSLVPFTSPIAMVLRLAFADVPLWQTLISIVLLIVSSILIVWIAAHIFRVGLLMYGRRMSLRTLWATLRTGLDIAPDESQEPA